MRHSPKRERVTVRRVVRSPATDRPIRFGTSGWRGVYGEEITLPRLRVLVRSIAHWLHEQGSNDARSNEPGADERRRHHETRRGSTVLVGYDRRFASKPLAEATAACLLDAGFSVALAADSGPTPVLTHALFKGDAIAGLMLTASHNPAADHGLKVFGSTGGTIADRDARRIEEIAAARMRDDGEPVHSVPDTCADWTAPYLRDLRACLDVEALQRAKLTVVYDAMHGSGAGVLDSILRDAGVEVRCLRNAVDARFGDTAPDPVVENLTALGRATADVSGLRLGLATDGDADRFGVVDGHGRALTETQVVALLLDHLASQGRIRKGIALTEGAGSVLERIAAHHGLTVERHPVGFKHLSEALAAGRVDAAGEESGGFALGTMGRDKDGIAAGCLLAELVATSGEGLETHLERLESRFGRSACGRRAVERRPETERALADLRRGGLTTVAGVRVTGQSDGIAGESAPSRLRFDFEDGGFLILRLSGTEARIRIYADAPSPEALEERLDAAVSLLEDSRSRSKQT